MAERGTQEACAYTDGASTGSRGPGGYGAVLTWKGKTEEISGGEQDTTNLRMEVTAACVALETIDEGHVVTVYSDSSYLVNCMRRGWYKKWRENGWLNHRKEHVANRDLWERLPKATQRHQEVRLLMPLSCCDQEGNRLAVALCSQVDLGAEAALAAPQRFIRMHLRRSRLDPLFSAPAACWCARTVVPSTWCKVQSIVPSISAWRCRAASTRSHTPALTQR